jgi:hypothetical protein
LHIFECNPKKPIKTAYHLCRAVFGDRIPDDEQTCEDYGFGRAFTPSNRSKLLGLYRGLMVYLQVKPKTVHQWRLKGTLVEEIKAAFETQLPEDNRGAYYAWFLQNQWVLDHNLPPPPDTSLYSMMIRGWKYAGGSASATMEEINAIRTIWPPYKQHCYEFCTTLLSGCNPPPERNIWLTFGFCVFEDEYSEGPLHQLYRNLLAKCTFDEIYAAYDSSSLITLLDRKGLEHDRKQIRHLDDVLAGSPRMNKSVWNLKQYVAAKDAALRPSVAVDYGFANCKGEGEVLELKHVYENLFSIYRADPIEVHEAAIGGRLFAHVGRFVTLKKKFNRILKNPYPLSMV